MNEQEIRSALETSYSIPDGPQKFERLELLAGEAKLCSDRALEGEVLLALISSYEYGGSRDTLPIPFGRLLKIHDEYPDALAPFAYNIHWRLKWMTFGLIRNPAVPLATVGRWMDEMESRYRERGYSARPVLSLRASLMAESGDLERADALLSASMVAPRDEMADCDACERDDFGSWRMRLGDDEGALEHWAPLLAGELSCMEEPHRTLSLALLPLVRTGRVEEARSTYLKGYPLVRRNIAIPASLGRFVEFCALTGNEARGLEILAEHASWLTDDQGTVSERLSFLTGVAVLLRRLSFLGHGDLPAAGSTVDALLATLETEINELAGRFDARNGNTLTSERIAARLGQAPMLDLLPLGASTVLPTPRPRPARASGRDTGLPVPTGVSGRDTGDLDALDALVAEARRLSAGRHPRADRAWERVAARGVELPEAVALDVANSRALALGATDPVSARAELLDIAKRYEALGDVTQSLATRSAAAIMGSRPLPSPAAEADGVAGLVAGDGRALVAEAAAVAGEADRLRAAGELDGADYLRARSAVVFIAVNTAADDARELAEAELALAAELGVPGRVALYREMLGVLALQQGDRKQVREHFAASVQAYLEAGYPWSTEHPAAMLAQLAAEDGDMAAAEGFARQAIAGSTAAGSTEETPRLASMLMQILAEQEGREADLAAAALDAAARWAGRSEPDTLHCTFTAARAYHRLERHAEATTLFAQAIDRVEVPYDRPDAVAWIHKLYAESLTAQGGHREAAEQFIKAVTLLQDDEDNRFTHAELAWSAARALERAGQPEEALPAYRRAAELWGDIGTTSARVRCLRSAAWILSWRDEAAGIAAMEAVIAELEAIADPSEGVAVELTETYRQREMMATE